MKNITLPCILLFALIITACEKKDKQHIIVKGHITYNNPASTPVPNALLTLTIDYDDPGPKHGHTNQLGMTSTDANGYYEISAEAVIPDETFRGYHLVYIDAAFGFGYYLPYYKEKTYYNGIVDIEANIDEGDKVVTKDLVFNAFSGIRFHIKNTSPVDTNDLFRYILLYGTKISINASGLSVDTAVLYFQSYFSNQNNYLACPYQAYYKKNGVDQTFLDTVYLKPLQTKTVDLFY